MQDALITLTGNVGTEVEFSQGEGWSLARFRLACTPRRVREGVWIDQETTWIGVNAWGRTAENIAASLAKGDAVVVHGKLRTSAWQGSDGVRHERLVVEAVALGHDLSRGRTSFTRNERRVLVEDGSRVDARTGEVLDEDTPGGRDGVSGTRERAGSDGGQASGDDTGADSPAGVRADAMAGS